MASSGSSGCPTQPHVAFVAFPFGTHAAPLFALARAVASAAPGTAVSFLSTARSLASLPRAEGLGNIRLVPVADGRPEGAAEVPPPGGIEEMIGMFLAATPGNLREALGAAAAGAGGIPVGCVVSDAFMWMAGDVAEAAGAPWVVLWTGGPAGLAAHLHTDLLRDAIGVGERAMTRFKEQLHSIPVLSAHRVCDLPEGIVFGPLDAERLNCLVQAHIWVGPNNSPPRVYMVDYTKPTLCLHASSFFLGLSPPGLAPEPSTVTPEAFLSLTKQVQTMAGMMQMLALIIPQIVQLVMPPTDPARQPPNGEQLGIREASGRATDPRGPPEQNAPASGLAMLSHLEPDTISSDSADDSLRAQLSRVNQWLDAFQRELRRSQSESSKGAAGGSPFTPEV
nr:PREDICTED: UDP-glycosyltransferase 78D2-like [Musa acuminata subsp. malaccensis]